MTKAEELAQNLGIEKDKPSGKDECLQAEIARLRKTKFVNLEHVRELHSWLNEKRTARQSCRITGESTTGKTTACKAYTLRYPPKRQVSGQPPTVPIVYIMPSGSKCGAKDLFTEIIKYLKYRAVKGTISDFRSRAMDVLRGCEVEMLIIDEADRLKPETFSEVRDISDKLEISVVLVGTDRLDAVIKRDEQVYNRFRSRRRFDLLVGDEFTKTVKIWEEKVLKLPVASNLHRSEMLTILKKASRGYIGGLDEILREAAIKSLSRGFKKIDKAVLKEVAKEYS